MKSRELKFRAWDKEYEEMVRSTELSFLVNIGVPANITDQYIWMQFTGLKDKNGVEIYEGDIVKNNIRDYSGDVAYSEGQFIVNDAAGSRYLGKGRLNELDEVIGNIYESPELLEK